MILLSDKTEVEGCDSLKSSVDLLYSFWLCKQVVIVKIFILKISRKICFDGSSLHLRVVRPAKFYVQAASSASTFSIEVE